jgi:hypothetical protein
MIYTNEIIINRYSYILSMIFPLFIYIHNMDKKIKKLDKIALEEIAFKEITLEETIIKMNQKISNLEDTNAKLYEKLSNLEIKIELLENNDVEL